MGKAGKSGRKSSIWRGVPRWARVCTVFGTVLTMLSGAMLVGTEVLMARYEGAVGKADLFGDQAAGAKEKKSDIKGPLNLLLVGIDPRTPTAAPLADSIMVLHVPATMDRAYLFSLPRDLYVNIPPFSRANFNGEKTKINAAMSFGSRVPGRTPTRREASSCWRPRCSRSPGSSGSTLARSSTSPASRRSSTRWAASTCTSSVR
ncbi:hypothetical protein GCM10027614_35070 [Micromonospora vulcania]